MRFDAFLVENTLKKLEEKRTLRRYYIMYCNSIIHSACIVIVLVVVGRTFGLGDN